MHINSGTVVAVRESGWLSNRLADVMSAVSPNRIYTHQQKAKIVIRMDSGHLAKVHTDKHAIYFNHLKGRHVKLYSTQKDEPGLMSDRLDPWAEVYLAEGRSADGNFHVVLGCGNEHRNIGTGKFFHDRGIKGEDFFAVLKDAPKTLPTAEPPSLREIFAWHAKFKHWMPSNWSEEYEMSEEESRREREHNKREAKRVAKATVKVDQICEEIVNIPGLEQALRQTANEMLRVNGGRLLRDRSLIFVPKASNHGIRPSDGIRIWDGLEHARDSFAKAVAGKTYVAVMAVDNEGVPVHAIVPKEQKEELSPGKLCSFGWQKRSFGK